MRIEINGYVITGTPAEVCELLQIEAPMKTPTTAAAKEPSTVPSEKKAPKNPGEKYDPEMPCNKKGCDASTRATCCGCPEQLAWERRKKRDKHGKICTS